MPKVWNKRDPKCPKDAVYVGRPSKWGNPYRIKLTAKIATREQVIEQFRKYAELKNKLSPEWLVPLKNKDLVCWCAPLSCHADILLKLANVEVE